MSQEDFLESYLEPLLHKLSKENKFTVLMGDFNINLLKYDCCKYSAAFHDLLASHSFQPLILQPTRVTLTSQTLIDNIFSNSATHKSKNGNLTSSISDHFAQFSIITDYNHKRKVRKKCYIFVNIATLKIENLRSYLALYVGRTFLKMKMIRIDW